MLDQGKFKEMRQVSVGKEEEKVKSRIKEIWLSLPKSQREEILNLSGLTGYAVARTYEKGRLSLKMALAFAQSLKINPYFLTGVSDEKDDFSYEKTNQFLSEYGHASLTVQGKEESKKKNNGKKADKSKPIGESATATPVDADSVVASVENAPRENDAIEEAVPVITTEAPDIASVENAAVEEEIKTKYPQQVIPSVDAEQQETQYDLLLSTLQEKIRSITETEQEKLNAIPFKAAKKMLKGLYLRTEYSDEAKYLVSLVKMLLMR